MSDQLNVSGLASMELLCMKMQMSECQHRARIFIGSANDELQEDLHLYMDTGETRGMVMIAPALFRREANVFKERRTMQKGETCVTR